MQIEPKFVDVDGITTRYFEAGSGEPMVLWHGDDFGGAANASTWDLNLEELAKTFHVYAADRLGQGFTDNPKTDGDYTAGAVTDHAGAFIKAMGLTSFHMVGQSRGAYVAGRVTLEYPEMVKTLTLVDTASLAPETGTSGQEFAQTLVNGPADVREYAYFRWAAMSYSTDHITEFYLDDSAAGRHLPKTAVTWEKLRALRASQYQPSVKTHKEETLGWIDDGRLKMPVLVVWGYNDPLAPLPSGLALYDRIVPHSPKAQMHIFNQAGHYPYREHAAAFNALLTDFILTNAEVPQLQPAGV